MDRACHCKTSLNDLAEHGNADLEIDWKVTGRGFVVGAFAPALPAPPEELR